MQHWHLSIMLPRRLRPQTSALRLPSFVLLCRCILSQAVPRFALPCKLLLPGRLLCKASPFALSSNGQCVVQVRSGGTVSLAAACEMRGRHGIIALPQDVEYDCVP